jgi:DNA-3-methyladenine glycosylase I
LPRCGWAVSSDAMMRYHDIEWGIPSHDDRHLFEMLVLEGAQAGLSWSTILNKREGYRRVFAGFDPSVVAGFGQSDIEAALVDPGIVRNRSKVWSAVRNARAFLEVQREHGSFDEWLWWFVDGRVVSNRPRSPAEVPASTELSDRLAKELKRRGFSFVGTTIVYAFLQSTGVVDDHLVSCAFKPPVA